MQDKLKIGLVGIGRWGENILKNLINISEISSIYLCDSNIDAAKRISHSYNWSDMTIKSKSNGKKVSWIRYEQLLTDEEIKLVFVATPIQTHASIVSELLGHEKNVFCEKPLCQHTGDAEYLFTIARQKKLLLQVDHTFLHAPEINFLKKEIDNNFIYGLKHFYSRRLNWGPFLDKATIIEDLCPHDISIVGYLFGFENLEYVSCDYFGNEAFVNFHFIDGFYYHNHVSWEHPQKDRYFTLIGENKRYVYDAKKSDILLDVKNNKEYKLESNDQPLFLSLVSFINRYLAGQKDNNIDMVYNVHLLNYIKEAYSKKVKYISLQETYKKLKDQFGLLK